MPAAFVRYGVLPIWIEPRHAEITYMCARVLPLYCSLFLDSESDWCWHHTRCPYFLQPVNKELGPRDTNQFSQ